MKRAASIIFVISLLLAGCQSVLPVVPDGEEEREYSGTLRVALFGGYMSSSDRKPYLAGFKEYPIQDRMEAFMEKHPNVQIEIIDISPDSFALPSLLRDPHLQPDIIEMNVNEARFTARDRIVGLAERIGEIVPLWDGDYSDVIDSAAIEGIPYLLPVRSNPMMVFYDKTLFGQLGMPEPKTGWTMAEFAAAADKLVQAGEAISTPTGLNEVEHIIRGWGGVYASKDRSQISGFLDSDATTEAFVRYAQMMPSFIHGGDPKELPAMGMWRANELLAPIRSTDTDYGFAPVPSTLEGTHYNTSLLTGLAITKESRQQELAWALMQFIVGDSSDEAMEFVARNTLEVDNRAFRSDENPKIAELREWMNIESAIATPATLDMFMARSGNLGNQYPYRTQEQIEAFESRDAAKQDLTLLAQQLESWMALLHATE
jgi:multiple sugar transport system substrate-binding protein